ncbi:MAG TPA: hypothetical protein VKP30_27515, partial [Polyangiaceae bacterium]|nr:hypothetical protein [Polyangiaceae bacterium]
SSSGLLGWSAHAPIRVQNSVVEIAALTGSCSSSTTETLSQRKWSLSVKSGHPKVADVRDLRGVLDRESATIGALILLEAPTREMVREAASAGFHESLWGRFPRLQLLTIEDLLAGKSRLKYPIPAQGNVGRRKAKRSESQSPMQQSLPFGAKHESRTASSSVGKRSGSHSDTPGPKKAAPRNERAKKMRSA